VRRELEALKLNVGGELDAGKLNVGGELDAGKLDTGKLEAGRMLDAGRKLGAGLEHQVVGSAVELESAAGKLEAWSQ
jgi:hypothetical protein